MSVLLHRQCTGPYDTMVDRTIMIAICFLLSMVPGVSAAFVMYIVFMTPMSLTSLTLAVLLMFTFIPGALAFCILRSWLISGKIANGSDQFLNGVTL